MEKFKLYSEEEMRCPVHLSIGQEAVAVGVCEHLQKNDIVMSAHRAHAHYLAKGGNLKAMLAELYGKSTGCAKGKGGSMHLIDLKKKGSLIGIDLQGFIRTIDKNNILINSNWKEKEEALILVNWKSKKLWKSIPMSEVNVVQQKFEDNVKAALNVGENPFKLIYEGELDKQR